MMLHTLQLCFIPSLLLQAHDDQVWYQQHQRARGSQGQPGDGAQQPSLSIGRLELITMCVK